ncbi:MAG: tape measure protein [Tannerellaceae bacterium]|jgi:tape measure domain-containing protein|nr:tape measure protein [Tannerellaceae bacterium]
MGIINKNNALMMAIGADPSDLYRNLNQAEVRIDQFGNHVKKAGDKIGMFLSAGFGGAVLTNFAKEVINVRGEIQQLEIAFETMLGTKKRADQMMADVKDLALRSPFTLTEVADNTKQLIAMGIATEDAVETVKALGDVSAGVAVPLSRIAINYGQVAALGRLQSREIRDFAMAGIPIVDELAKMLGKTSAEIFEMVEAGKIGFPAVEQAFKNMSGEGGKFYNLMEKQNASVTGQISKLKDSFQLMYNEIGQGSEGVIYSAIEGASLLIENYEKVGRVLISLIATYGAYRAALILTSATSKGYTVAQLAQLNALIAVEKAQKLLNATILKNQYVAITVLVVGLASAMWALSDRTTSAEKAQERYNSISEKLSETLEKNKQKSQELLSVFESEVSSSKERQQALEALKAAYPSIFKDYDVEKLKLADILELKKQIAEVDLQRSTQSLRSEYVDALKDRDKIAEEIEFRSQNYGNGQYKYGEFQSRTVSQLRKDFEVSSELVKKLSSDLQKDMNAAWEANTPKEVKVSSLESVIKNLENEKKRLEYLKEDNDSLMPDIISDAQIANINKQITEYNKELENLKKTEQTPIYGADYQAAKKEWETAKKELESIEKDKDAFTTKQYNDAKSRAESAKKTFEELGGVTKVDKSSTAPDRLLKEKLDLENRLNNELLKLQQDNISSGIALMEDGYEKRLALINNEYDREIASIRQKEQEWRDAQGGNLTIDQTSAIDLADENAFQKRMQLEESLRKEAADAEKQSWIDYNKEYGDYQAKRLAITEDYARRIAAAQTGGEKASLSAEQDKAVQELDQSMVEQSDLWVRLFEDADRQTNEFIKKIIAETEQLLDYINGVEGATIPIGFTPEQLETLKKDPEKIKDIWNGLIEKRNELNSRNPFGQLINGFKDLKKASTDADKKKAFSDISSGIESVSGMLSDVGSAWQNILGEEASETVGNVTTALTGMAQTGSGVAKVMAGDFTGVVDILKGIPAMIDGFANLFGGGNDNAKLQRQIDQYNEIVSLYDSLIDKQKEYLETLTGEDAQKQAAEIEKMIERQTAAAQSSLEAWFKSGASWKSHSEGWHFNKNFSKELGGTGDILEFDAAKWKELRDNVELWQRLPEEVRAYGEAVIGAEESTEDLAKSLKESFTGISFDSIKDSLDDIVSMADMTFEDISDSFEDHMSKAVLHMVKNQYLTNELMKWYEQFSAAASDGQLTQAETEALQNYYTQIAEKGNELYKQAMDLAGVDITKDDNGSASDNSLAGALGKASQESIDILGGTMGRISVILEDMKRMMAGSVTFDASAFYQSFQDSLQAIYDLQIKGWEDVKAIRDLSRAVSENTAEIARLTEEQGKTLVSINNNTGAAVNRLNGTLDVKQKGGGGLGS